MQQKSYLCVPFLETARPWCQFSHSCVGELIPGPVHIFPAGESADRSWNWDTGVEQDPSLFHSSQHRSDTYITGGFSSHIRFGGFLPIIPPRLNATILRGLSTITNYVHIIVPLSIVGTFKSLTDTCIWQLGLWLRNSFSENICFEFSVLVLNSAGLSKPTM